MDEAILRSALKQVKHLTGLHGRWEMISAYPRVILDVAHNADGIREINKQLELMNFEHLHIVTGMVKDKDAEAVLKLLPVHARYYFTKASIPRALDEQVLMEEAKKHGLSGNAFPEVNEALNEAMLQAEHNDLILVCGSVFLIAEVKLPLSRN